MSDDAQKAYCAKRSSLRCYSMVPSLSPNVLMALTSRGNSLTLSLLMVGSTTQYTSLCTFVAKTEDACKLSTTNSSLILSSQASLAGMLLIFILGKHCIGGHW